MRSILNVTLLMIAITVLSACSSAQQTQPSAGSGATTVSTSPTTSPTSAVATSPAGRDISSVDVCNLLKGEDVVAITGGQLLKPAQSSNLGKTTRGCSYEIQPKGTGTYANYIVYVQSVSLVEATLSFSEPDQKGEKVSGIGDEAYITYDKDLDQYDLLALRKGDVGVEVKGDQKEVVTKLGDLMFSKLLHNS